MGREPTGDGREWEKGPCGGAFGLVCVAGERGLVPVAVVAVDDGAGEVLGDASAYGEALFDLALNALDGGVGILFLVFHDLYIF